MFDLPPLISFKKVIIVLMMRLKFSFGVIYLEGVFPLVEMGGVLGFYFDMCYLSRQSFGKQPLYLHEIEIRLV